jgi:phenylalanyl-tRNA synthetase beta chain
MLVSYNWLKDFVDIAIPPEELARNLTSLGLEIASLSIRHIPQGVIVGRVIEVKKHPNADKLSLCSVDNGTGTPLPVVCGAPNVVAGMKTALATVGAQLSKDFVIKQATIRGVQSEGMLCSERELGISDDHSGIMKLPDSFVVGKPLSEYYPDDAILEVEITPNRGDCLSLLGVAREIAAKLSVPLKDTALVPQESGDRVEKFISVGIEEARGCPRYLGRLIRGVTIAPSPEWMQHRLIAAGVRPINNVVDITNYIMLQFGHPMHSFDYAAIADQKIVVKRARDGQKFVTLDDKEHALIADDLLIYDGQKAVALAGIMGGKNSEIAPTTRDVFLECAFFDPVGIRKTAKRLGLSSESSYRFERGVDPGDGLVNAINTAAELTRQLAGGTVAPGLIDACPELIATKTIPLRAAQVHRLLGIRMSEEVIVSSLKALGMQVQSRANGTFSVTAPTFRHDIGAEADLIEELGRLYGYDNIPSATQARVSLLQPANPDEKLLDEIRATLAAQGCHEVITNSMSSEKRNALLTPDVKPVVIINPLNPDMAQMRTSMLGSMLEAVAYNLNRKNLNNRFFEIGTVFSKATDSPLAIEREILAIALEGNWWGDGWNAPKLPDSYYVLKGIVDACGAVIGEKQLMYAAMNSGATIFGSEASSVSSSTGIRGRFGKVAENLCAAFDIKSPVYYAELDITALLGSARSLPVYRPLSPFPAVERDFCFVMDEQLLASALADDIKAISPHIEWVRPFDVYREGKLGPGKKSIAYAVRIRALDHTMTDKETEPICATIVKTLSSKYGITLRT